MCVFVLQVTTGVLIVRHEGVLRLWAGWRPAVARAMCYGGERRFLAGAAGQSVLVAPALVGSVNEALYILLVGSIKWQSGPSSVAPST